MITKHPYITRTTYRYGANGNRTAMTRDPTGLNQQTRYTYDALNRSTTSTDADNSRTTTTYDAREKTRSARQDPKFNH